MKTLKVSFLNIFAIASAMLFMTSCEKSVTNASALRNQNESNIEGSGLSQSYQFPLVAAQSLPAGKVTVSNDESNLYITYQLENGWRLQAVHANIQNALTSPVPKSNNDISPGQFPYKATFSMAGSDVTTLPDTYTFTIPLTQIGFTEAIIYAHASVIKPDGSTASAWGGTIVGPGALKWYGSSNYSIMIDGQAGK